MSDNFESWLLAELKFRKNSLLNCIEEINSIMRSLKHRVEEDSNLNDLGELQSSGVLLDTAVAAYATQRQVLKNYQEMKKDEV